MPAVPLSSDLKFALSLPTLVGAWCCVRALSHYLAAKRTMSWRKVKGEITASELETIVVRSRTGKQDRWRARIEYSYQIGGMKYLGSRVYPGADQWRNSNKFADELLSRYLRGEPVDVYVNPGSLGESVLERGQYAVAKRDLRLALMWFGGVFALWYFFTRIQPNI